jgi:hypothetical protein
VPAPAAARDGQLGDAVTAGLLITARYPPSCDASRVTQTSQYRCFPASFAASVVAPDAESLLATFW